MVLTEAARDALATASEVVVSDPDLDLLEAILDIREQIAENAQERIEGTPKERIAENAQWRLLLSDSVADTLAYEFVLATRLEEHIRKDEICVRQTTAPAATVIATPQSAFAVAGPASSRTLLSTTETADQVRNVALEQFESAVPVDLTVPAREGLITSAEERLSERFAADLVAALAGTDRLHRSNDVNVLTLLVAIGARQNHLFGTVRNWADDAGVAPRQLFLEERDKLVDAGVVETIKLPMGEGHPRSRLRVTDDSLAECSGTNLVECLDTRLHAGPRAGSTTQEQREPVWKRDDPATEGN